MFNLAHPGPRRSARAPRDRRGDRQSLARAAARRTDRRRSRREDLPNWMWAFDPSVQVGAVRSGRRRRSSSSAPAGSPGPTVSCASTDARSNCCSSTDTQTATHRSESLLVQAALRRVGIVVEIKYFPHRHPLRAARHGRHHARRKVRSAPLSVVLRASIPTIRRSSRAITCRRTATTTRRYCSAAMDAAQAAALIAL